MRGQVGARVFSLVSLLYGNYFLHEIAIAIIIYLCMINKQRFCPQIHWAKPWFYFVLSSKVLSRFFPSYCQPCIRLLVTTLTRITVQNQLPYCAPRAGLYICTPITRINFALNNIVLFAYRISNSATTWLLARRFAAIVYASCSLGGAALFPLSRLPLLIQTLPALQLATDTASFSHTE